MSETEEKIQIRDEIKAMSTRLDEVERKLELAYSHLGIMCPCCGDEVASEEHECQGDYNGTGKRCRCCSSYTHDCAMSV
jgi:hypothetical protein